MSRNRFFRQGYLVFGFLVIFFTFQYKFPVRRVEFTTPIGVNLASNPDLAAKTCPIGVRNPSNNVRGAMNCATTNAYILKFTHKGVASETRPTKETLSNTY